MRVQIATLAKEKATLKTKLAKAGEVQAKASFEEAAQMKFTILRLRQLGRRFRSKAQRLETVEIPQLRDANKNAEKEMTRMRAQILILRLKVLERSCIDKAEKERKVTISQVEEAHNEEMAATMSRISALANEKASLELKLSEAEEQAAQAFEQLETSAKKENCYQSALASAREKIQNAEREIEGLRAHVAELLEDRRQDDDGGNNTGSTEKLFTEKLRRGLSSTVAKGKDVGQLGQQQAEEEEHQSELPADNSFSPEAATTTTTAASAKQQPLTDSPAIWTTCPGRETAVATGGASSAEDMVNEAAPSSTGKRAQVPSDRGDSDSAPEQTEGIKKARRLVSIFL